MTKKFSSTVAGASILITTVGLIGKGLGLIREVVFAGFFGLNTQYDLYLVGAVFPLTINTIILYLGQNYFIPNYNKKKNEAPGDILAFTNSTFWSFTGFGLLLTLILYYFSSFIVRLYLQTESLPEFLTTLNIFRIFILTIPLNSAFAVLAAFLQSEFEFKSPAVAQLFLNISIIVLVVIFSNKIGVYTIPFGYVVGSLAQLVFLVVKSLKKIKLNLFTFIKGSRTRSIINNSLIITILIESIGQIYLLADRYFFGSVQQGGIAALNYAMNLYLLPIAIISTAVSTAIFPSISQSLISNLKEDVQRKLDNFFCINLFIFIPISLILFFYGNVLIEILFQRGEFSRNATNMTFEVLKYYSISLVFYSTYAVINKLLYGANLIKILLAITIAGCALKIGSNFLLVNKYMQNGLAMSTSISYFFFFISGIIVIVHKLNLKIVYFLKESSIDILNGMISFLISIVLIPGKLFSTVTIGGFIRITIFILIYILNSKLINHKAIKLFENVIGSYSSFKVKRN